MAMAYGALANGGFLMEPRLVRETRAPGEAAEAAAAPRRLRRVIPADVAREIGRVLVDVVEDGTGTAARLETYALAGKTGTSRVYTAGQGYVGNYFASFAGFFPADDPQLVLVIKLDSPQGAYYGGSTAAPAIRATLEAALAARTSLDRGSLMRSARAAEPSTRPATRPVRFASADAVMGSNVAPALVGAPEMPWQPAAAEVGASFAPDGSTLIPEVTGLSARLAVRRLHAAGLRVSWRGGGVVEGSKPAPGSRALPGDTITLVTRPTRP
jgi:membrane peptidoglycan carboxypeptidase